MTAQFMTIKHCELLSSANARRNSLSKLIKRLVVFGGLIILSACGEQVLEAEAAKASSPTYKQSQPSPYGRDAVFNYPEFSGHYSVGTHSILMVDQSRQESFIQNSVDKRKLQVRFYYPTDRSEIQTTSQKLPVISQNAWQFLIGHQEIAGKRLRFDNYQSAEWEILINAKISKTRSAFPVLVFSHGYGYSAESYSALSAELASKGYIVVSINHTFGANPADVGENQLIWAEPLKHDALGKYLPIWSDDQVFVIDQLSNINSDSNSIFHQKLELSNLGIFGHSYGGAAAYHSASIDPRIKAIADIDGTIFNFENVHITQPFAFLLSRNHQPKFDFRLTTESSYTVRLPQFSHASFTDHILWWQWDHDDFDLGLGQNEALRTIELTTELIDDFFGAYLKNQQSFWFAEEEVISPDVIVARKNQSI